MGEATAPTNNNNIHKQRVVKPTFTTETKNTETETETKTTNAKQQTTTKQTSAWVTRRRNVGTRVIDGGARRRSKIKIRVRGERGRKRMKRERDSQKVGQTFFLKQRTRQQVKTK